MNEYLPSSTTIFMFIKHLEVLEDQYVLTSRVVISGHNVCMNRPRSYGQ